MILNLSTAFAKIATLVSFSTLYEHVLCASRLISVTNMSAQKITLILSILYSQMPVRTPRCEEITSQMNN